MRIKKSIADWEIFGMGYYVGTFDFGAGDVKWCAAREQMLEHVNLYLKLRRILDGFKPEVEKLKAEIGPWPAVMILANDAIEFTLNPDMLVDRPGNERPGGRKRLLALIAHYPDFALAYLLKLRQAARKISDEAKAITALRLNPPKPGQYDKEFAGLIGVEADTVKKARQMLAAYDLENVETPDFPPKGLTKKIRSH